jgi:hypothetical protein
MMDEPTGAESEGLHREDGVDVTMIRWMLSLTPLERLQVLQQFINTIERFRARRSPE